MDGSFAVSLFNFTIVSVKLNDVVNFDVNGRTSEARRARILICHGRHEVSCSKRQSITMLLPQRFFLLDQQFRQERNIFSDILRSQSLEMKENISLPLSQVPYCSIFGPCHLFRFLIEEAFLN